MNKSEYSCAYSNYCEKYNGFVEHLESKFGEENIDKEIIDKMLELLAANENFAIVSLFSKHEL